jgi:transposase InsO family protein
LGQFDYKLNYIPGPLNTISDAMSRIHVIATILSEQSMLDMYELIGGVDILSLPTDKEWADAQRKDTEWYPFVRWIEKAELPDDEKLASEILGQAKLFALYGEHKLLVRIAKLGEEDPTSTVRKVVPSCWRKLILTQYHDSMFQGTHAGVDKTYRNVSSKYYFKNLAKYVDAYIKTCHVCQKIKDPVFRNKPWLPLGNIEATRPWELCCIDLWAPGTRSRSGNIYVLTVIDGFSKFAFIVAIPNKEAVSIANALWNIFHVFGSPERLHSDLGKEFVNETLEALCDIFGTEKSNTTAYHPQGNAYAERIHKFFKQAVASYCLDDFRNWDEMLKPLIMAYNDSYHTALGCTPSEVFLGRRLGAPPPPKNTPVGDYTELGWVQKMEYIFAKTHALVFAKLEEKKKRNQKISDKEKGARIAQMSDEKAEDYESTTFEVGQLVMLYRPKVLEEASFKLSPHWYGPYKVDKVGRHSKFYYLKDPAGDSLKFPVSILRLKAYNPREDTELPVEKFPEDIIQSVEETSTVTRLDEPRVVPDEDEDTYDFNQEFENPEEEFVPVLNPSNPLSQEEDEVLQSVRTGKFLKTRNSVRKPLVSKRYQVVDYKTKHAQTKKRRTRLDN